VELRVGSAIARPRAWTWYVLAAAAWFLSNGLNGVIIPALVTQELRAGAGSLTIVQTASQIPTILLILVGGTVADRADRRALLIGLYLAAALLTAVLALRVGEGWLSLVLVATYGFALGAVAAFLMPARDALLSDVATGDLLRSVGVLTMVQWSMQALGNFSASLGQAVGIAPLLAFEAGLLSLGALAVSRLPARPRPLDAPPRAELSLAALAAGVREVARSPVLRPVAFLAISLGVLFIGPFLVAFPLLVRDFYGGGKASLSLFLGCFPLGVIASSLVLLQRGGLRRKGLAQLVALASGGLCMGVLGAGPPFAGALAAVFAFGLGGAMFMTASRTLFQTHAPAAHRGRVLSVYTLATMGASGLVGAPVSGFLVAHAGPLGTCRLAGVAMLALVSVFALFTRVRELE
jgi:MFS family permease